MRSNSARLFRRSTLRGSIAAPVRRTLSTKSFGDTFLPKYARLIEKNFPRTGKRCNLAVAMCETEKELGTNYSSIAIAGTPAHLAFGLLRWDTALETSLVGYATSVQRPDGASDVVLNTVLLSDKVVSTKDQEVPTEWIHWHSFSTFVRRVMVIGYIEWVLYIGYVYHI